MIAVHTASSIAIPKSGNYGALALVCLQQSLVPAVTVRGSHPTQHVVGDSISSADYSRWVNVLP